MNRKAAVQQSIHSMEMEGFVFSNEDKAIFEKLAKGDISHADVRKIAAEKLKRWQKENPEAFARGI